MLLEAPAARALVRLRRDKVCSRCLARLARQPASQTLYRSSIHTKRKLHGALVPDKGVQRNMLVSQQSFVHDYFSANTSIDRGWIKNGLLAAWRTVADSPKTGSDIGGKPAAESSSNAEDISQITGHESKEPQTIPATYVAMQPNRAAENTAPSIATPELLPHRRRQRLRKEAKQAEPYIPPDASSQLTTAAANLPASASIRRRIATYLSLSKPRLSFLILLTTTSAYSLYPIPDIISTTSSLAPTTLSTSTLTLLFLTTGTFLSSASANTLNMLMEPKHDAQMSRTRNRPLVRNLISQRSAAMFALVTGSVGLTLLSLGTNDTVAFLSALNIFLYAGVYTPLKRVSVVNTWVGALVGGIPPLMGWAAAAGQAATSEHHSWRDLLFSEDSVGGWLLAALLFAWQFPHFNAIAHGIRNEYKNAGFKMMAWTNPARSGRVAFRYSLAMFPICAGLYWAGIVNEGFLAISTGCNLWMTREAWKFWRQAGAGGSARGLFWASVWQLPLVLVGALVCKTGLWEGFFENKDPSRVGESEDGAAAEEGDSILGGKVGQTISDKKALRDINLAMIGFKRPS